MPHYADRPHVLIVDDDRRIRDLLSRYLTEQGFIVLSAADAFEAEALLNGFAVDVMVVDVMMPEKTGLEFVRERQDRTQAGAYIPVILLTALGETQNRIDGLEAGADDYLAKPFEPKELLLRLHAILKRTGGRTQKRVKRFKMGRWVFDPSDESLQDGGSYVKLTNVETALLRALIQSHGQTLTREELAKRCSMDDAGERTIDVQVTRLRRKIEDEPKNPRYLQTLRGKGYILRGEEV